MLCMPSVTDDSIIDIFKPIIEQFLGLGFQPDVISLASSLVNGTNMVF